MKHFMTNNIVYKNVRDGKREGIFWACLVQIAEVHTYTDLAILLLDWHYLG